MRDVEMVRIQEEHIKRLQEKLDEKKQAVIDKLLNTPGWLYFLMKRTNSYYRPHRSIEEVEDDITLYGKLDFVFDDKGEDKVSFRGSYNHKSGYNFRTIFFPITEIDEFIKDSVAERPHKYQYWSTL